MKLSVVIVSYNVRYFLELCIKSVQLAIHNLEAEIIVIDNNSTDTTCQMLAECFPKIKLIKNLVNVGFSKANNQGVRIAKGTYICILNPDTVVAEDTFTKMLSFASTQNNLGIIGCKLIDGSGHFLPESKRNIPYIKIALLKILGYTKPYYATQIAQTEIAKTEILVGAFMLLKREVYHKMNGFDEDYFMYGEDIDLSYRVLKSGLDNYYYGASTVIHFKGESTLKNKIYASRFFGAMQLFYKKHLKTNVFLSTLIWLSIRSMYVLNRTPKIHYNSPKRYCLLSDKTEHKLQEVLPQKLIRTSVFDNLKSEDELIFDASYISYKNIIDVMMRFKNHNLSYKILPKTSYYIIGSHQKNSQGEVIVFK